MRASLLLGLIAPTSHGCAHRTHALAFAGGRESDPGGFSHYAGLVYEVGRDDVRRAMGGGARVERIRQVSVAGRGPGLNCHSQGIAVGSHVVTSCMDRRSEVGWLQFFSTEGLDGVRPRARLAVPTRRGRFAHAVTGQALLGRGPAHGRMLVPVVSEGRGKDPTLVDVRDERGAVVCSFVHETPGGLAAAALTRSRDTTLLIGVSRSHVFVYALDDASAPDCGRRLLYDGRGRTLVGAASWPRYQAIAVFSSHAGEAFVMASHGRWLDTYAFEGLGTARMHATKLATVRFRGRSTHPRGLFYEGMTIERLDDRTLRVWALPHDYWRGPCGPRASCTRAVYRFDRRFSSPRTAAVDEPSK